MRGVGVYKAGEVIPEQLLKIVNYSRISENNEEIGPWYVAFEFSYEAHDYYYEADKYSTSYNQTEDFDEKSGAEEKWNEIKDYLSTTFGSDMSYHLQHVMKVQSRKLDQSYTFAKNYTEDMFLSDLREAAAKMFNTAFLNWVNKTHPDFFHKHLEKVTIL